MNTETTPKQTPLLFSGKKGAGKDTVARPVMERLGCANLVHLSFAGPLKDEVDEMLDIIRVSAGPQDAVRRLQEFLHDVPADQVVHLVQTLYMAAQNPDEHARSHSAPVVAALQFYGTEVRRTQDPDYWVGKAVAVAKQEIAKGNTPYFTDARYPNELRSAREIGARTVRLEVSPEEQLKRISGRDGYVPSASELQHSSEIALDGFDEFDVIVRDLNIPDTIDYIVKQLS